MENVGIKNGLYLGLISILITLSVYLIDVKLFSNFMVSITSIIIMISFMAWAVSQQRQANGGFISFGEAFKTSLITGIVSVLISLIFSYILFNLIDPDAQVAIKEAQMDTMAKFTESMSEGDAEKVMQQIEDSSPFNLKGTLMGLVSGAVIAAIISLIIASIIKRQKSEWE